MGTGEEDCVDRVFQSALAGLGCGTTVAYTIRKTTERFFASPRREASVRALRMTASGAPQNPKQRLGQPPGPRDFKKYITCGGCPRVYFQPTCRNSRSSRQKFGGKL